MDTAPAATAEPPLRVLLVEDDPLVRQLLEMVWEDFDLTLTCCTRVSEALAALRTAPADLIVTDLMLPGESGLDLLTRLAAEPALRGAARVAVFSAGLSDATQARLRPFHIWRVLHKPLPIDALLACVEDAGARPRTRPGPAASGTATGPSTDASVPQATLATRADDDPSQAEAQAQALAEHFGGNRPLFEAFRCAALLQFPQDLTAGDEAVRRADAPALQRLAHSLKSVLRSLGHGAFAQLAAALESTAEQADWPVARPQWMALRAALAGLAATPASHALHTTEAAPQQSVTPPGPGP